MHQKHKNSITSNELKQLKKPRFDHLLRPLAWKRSGSILKAKDKKKSKDKRISGEAYDVNKQMTYIAPNSTNKSRGSTSCSPHRAG